MFVNMRNKVHATCKYWKNRRCHKSAAKCNFVHAYICQNDGRCHYDKCTHLHFKQEAPYIRNKWGFGGRRNFRFGGGRGGRNRQRSRSRSRSMSYGRGRSRSRSRSRGRSYRSFSRSRSRSLRGGSREGSFDRSFDRLHRSRSRGRMSRSMSRSRLSRSRSRSRHMSLDRISRSGSRGRGRSRSRRSMSMGRSVSPSPIRERGGLRNRSQSRRRSWSPSRSRSGSRGRLGRSRSGSRPRMGRSGMRGRGGRSRSGSRSRVGRSRSGSRGRGSRGRGGRSRSGSRGRLGRSRSGSGGRLNRSRSGSRSRVSRSTSRERIGSREGRSRSASGSREDDRSRSGSRSRRRDSRSGSRSRHWSRSQSARSRSPSPGGGRNGERFSHKSPDDRRDSPEGAGGISEATKSSYAAFTTAYPSSSSYAADPNAYPSASYQNPSSFTPTSGFSGEHPYPPLTYSTAYPTTSTSYATNTYESSQQSATYSTQFNETTYSSQSANQAANSPGSSSSHHNSDSDGLELGKGDETILGLEEVGEEVDDTYGSSMIRSVEESISDALMQGIQRGKRLREVQKEVSSSKNLTDWELKCVLENPSKPIETMPPPVAQDPQLSGELARRNEMWTPALDRRSVAEAKQKMSQRTNDWEIETPYITRSSKASSGGQVVGRDVPKVVDTVANLKMDLKLSSQQKSTKTLFPSAVIEADTLSSVAQSYSSLDDNSKRMPPPKEFAVPDIPSISSSNKKTEGSESAKDEKKSQSKRGGEESSSKKSSKERKEKKKKKKRRKRTSSSDSEIASDTDDSEADKKKEAQERAKKEAKERIKLLEKKDELLNKVHLLVVEREKLERQRDEIVQNHKGDSKSLKSILEDNSGLMKEIHKQIFSMDEMISKVNSALGISDQGKEKHRDLLGKGKSPPVPPPPPPSMPRHSSSTPPVVRKVESAVDNEPYGPLPALKTYKEVSPLKTVHVKYVDQGMHWCKLCGIFCNNITGYIEHLESSSHVDSTKMEKKTWLAKAARPEKDRIAPNAQTITEPLQGSEFLHSLLVFYCSLCDSFLRDRKEAIHHPETKLHVSMYKNHLAKNSMYEASYMKAKMGAYATFKINQEKQKRESLESLEREKGLKKEAREKELAEIRHKGSKESEIGKDAKDRDREANVGGDDGREYGSIRVASRGPSRKRDRDEEDRRWEDREDKRWEERDRRKKDYEWREERGRRDHEDRKGYDRRKQDRGRGEQSSRDDTPSPPHSQCTESKKESSAAGKNNESDRISEKNNDNEKEPKDENQLTAALSTKPKLPLIGKMPFFKKKGSATSVRDRMDKHYDMMEFEGKGVKQEMEEDMDIDEKDQILEVVSPVPVPPELKLEEEKPIKKLEEEKPIRKQEEEKPIKKLEDEKPIRKLEEEKVMRKLEDEKPTRASDSQVRDSLEDEKQERREAEAPIKSIPLPPVLGCADERDAEASRESVKYSPTKAEMEEQIIEKEEVEGVKENIDVGSDSSSSVGGQEISVEDGNEKAGKEEEEEETAKEEQEEESHQNQPTSKRGKGRGRGRSRGRGRGKNRGKSRTSTDVEEKEEKEDEQVGSEEQHGGGEEGERGGGEEEEGGRGGGSEVEGDVEQGENETASKSGKVKSRTGRGAQAAKEAAAPTRRSRRQSARLAAKEEEKEEMDQDLEQEQEEGTTPFETVEEEVGETYPSVVPSDFSPVEEPTQDDGSAFYQPEEITMPSVDSNMGMEDHGTRIDLNSVTMNLHADPGIGACSIMPVTSMGMAVDPATAVFPVVHNISATESSSVVPEDPLFPPGTEPNMMVEEEKDDLDEVPMDTEEEPQEPYIGDISDTLKHIGQSDHFDKLEEMKLLGIDIDDVAATSSME